MNYTRQYNSKRIDCEHDKCGEWHSGGHELHDLLPEDTYTIVYQDQKWSYCIVCDMATIAGSYVHIQCREKLTLRVAQRFGSIDGAHHKQWVIDQMLRSLLVKEDYEDWVKEVNKDPENDPWDVGIAP